MISIVTHKAILALLAADPTATDAERDAVARALRSESTKAEVISFNEASRRLGRSRQHVYNLVRAGRLRTVRGAGKFNCGITAKSLEDFINHDER